MAATPEHWQLKDLHAHLQAGMEIELLVMPPYLTALYSLHPGSNREAELIIRSVVVEEMLHLTLAANLLNAVGGKPRVADATWAPRYPAKIPYYDTSFEIGLHPFGDTALDAFLAVENPSYAPAESVSPAPPGSGVPRLLTLDPGDGETYATVGDFYDAVETGLRSLVERLGEKAVFSGRPELQIGPEHYYAAGGAALRVHNLATALEALEEIVEQGEGELTIPPSGEKFDRERDLAHFYRFDELRRKRRYLVDDEPREPTGEPVEIDPEAVYPMRPNLRLREIPPGELREAATECCRIWSRLLDLVQVGISGTPAALGDAVVTMFDLKYAAQRLLRVPLPDGSGEHAGPTFEYLPTESREEPVNEPNASANRPLPPMAPGDETPFYYASLSDVEVLYRLDVEAAESHLADSGLKPAVFADGGTAGGFNFQMYTSHFPDSMGRTMEIELYVLALPATSTMPQVEFRDWVLGMDQAHEVGYHRIFVPCDDPIAIEAGERKFGEPKFFTQFLPELPSSNSEASGKWAFACCDPGYPPGPNGNDGEARAHAIFDCAAQTEGLLPEQSYPSPFTLYGSVTQEGSDKGRLIAARWSVFGPWQTYFLDRDEATRVALGFGDSSHPMQKAVRSLFGDVPAAVVRTYASQPCSVQPRTYWP